MAIFPGSAIPSAVSDYEIDNSLRFNDGDTSYLSFTPSSEGNKRTWTYSCWTKLTTGVEVTLLGAGASPNQLQYYIKSTGELFFWMQSGPNVVSTAQLRDPSAWYHIVLAVDTTQATAANRVKFYINGEHLTDITTETYPTQNLDTPIGDDVVHRVGIAANASSQPFDGYLAEVYMINGTQLTPSSFGELDSTTNQWIPKDAKDDLTFGTNGFYQKYGGTGTATSFEDSSASDHTITRNGDVINSRAQKKIGDSSILFDGTGDSLELAASSDWDFGTGAYTVEGWIKTSDTASQFVWHGAGAANTTGFRVRVQATDGYLNLTEQVSGDHTIVSTTAVNDGNWHHWAVSRVASEDSKMFIDGVHEATMDDNYNFDNDNVQMIGIKYGGNEPFDGYMDEIRVSNSARYTANFTPSTTAFTPDSNTKFLLHSNFDGGLGLDSSGEGNNFTPTNLVATDQMVDTPTNNFATMNPLAGGDGSGGGQVLSEGNLKDTAATDNSGIALTMGLPGSGKWYWEWEVEDYEDAMFIGIYAPEKVTLDQGTTTSEGFWTYRGDGGSLYGGGTSIVYGDSWNTNGDIVGVAADMDNGTLHFAVNNVWEGTATNDLLTTGYDWIPALKMHNTSSGVLNLNAGSDSSFAGEKTAQGNQDGNDKGDFYYTPPTLGDLEQTAKMTGASAPSPNAVTASAYDTVNDNKSWYAFDSIRSRKWGLYDASNVGSNALPATLTYDFGSGNGCALNKYRILGDDNPNRMPNTWSIHGSNDDSDYTLLDTQTGITWPSDYSWKTYTFSNTTSYRYLRFTYTSNNGDSNYAQLMELQYYDTARTGNFLALCTDNLSDPEIALPGENFNTVLWTGTGSTNAISGVGFAPDWVWIKNRDESEYHHIYDRLRGVLAGIYSNSTNAQETTSGTLTAFGSDGFTVATDHGVNENTKAMVAWNWKAGGAPTADNSAGVGAVPTAGSVKIDGSNLGSALAGTIAAKRLSANTTSGFSIVQYVGTGSGATIAHGLSQAPDMVISKAMEDAYNWRVGGEALGLTSANYSVRLDLGNAEQDLSGVFGAYPGPSVWTIGTDAGVNVSTENYIAYCFHSVEGYSKVGSYVGNGNADGTFIYTGFRPAWILVKNTTATGNNWEMWDNKRDTYNIMNHLLEASSIGARITSAEVDFVSNGFKVRSTSDAMNDSGENLLYLAFAESPFKYSNAR